MITLQNDELIHTLIETKEARDLRIARREAFCLFTIAISLCSLVGAVASTAL